jgi:hypothetical protein
LEEKDNLMKIAIKEKENLKWKEKNNYQKFNRMKKIKKK